MKARTLVRAISAIPGALACTVIALATLMTNRTLIRLYYTITAR